MAELARVPANDALSVTAARPPRAPRKRLRAPRLRRRKSRYYAFLSYSHRDEEIADWLHRELEEFRVPRGLSGKLTENGVLPKRLTPVFRDEHELAAADDLGEEIEAALASSQYLIVLCSPDAAKSHWTNAEIELFKRTRPDGCILAAIASGEPFAIDIPGREHEECFPPALRQRYDSRGRPTGKRAEPLAADLRDSGDGRRLGFLKLVAGLLGVGLDELVQRETTRRHRRMAWLAAASLAGMAVTSTLALTAIQARDAARDQRREAEGLVAFMLGDLRDKLEPIGRLDALDGVGSRVLAYYSKQDASDLSDAALLQRSRALSLTAQVAYLRGNLGGARQLYSEAMAGTKEAIRRNPNDPQRLYDHAQNIFWLADIAGQHGDLKSVEAYYREYKHLTGQMVALDPNNMKWRMERQDADVNLGIILYNERRFPEAAGLFDEGLRTIDALATADPANKDYQESLVETLAWSADGQLANDQLARAMDLRKRQLSLLNALMRRGRPDVEFRQKATPAEEALGRLYAYTGQTQLGLSHLRAAVASADQLVRAEPGNAFWREQAFRAHLAVADFAMAAGRRDEASSETQIGCAMVIALLAQGPQTPARRAGSANCEMLQARLALTAGTTAEAVAHARQALRSALSVGSSDPAADQYRKAKAYRLLGDALHAARDEAGASAGWSSAARALPQGIADRPFEIEERLLILERNGQTAGAKALASKLNSMGYRRSS